MSKKTSRFIMILLIVFWLFIALYILIHRDFNPTIFTIIGLIFILSSIFIVLWIFQIILNKKLYLIIPIIAILIIAPLSLVSSIAFSDKVLTMLFERKEDKYNEFILTINNSDLYKKNGLVDLPKEYSILSADGKVKISWDNGNYNAIFDLQKGFFSSFSMLYASNGHLFEYNSDHYIIKPYHDNWYFFWRNRTPRL